MNWFERYGIPGLYLIFLFVTLCLFGLNINVAKKSIIINGINLKLEIIISIIAFLVSISLPIGYILSIISLFLYYKLPEEFSILEFTKLHTKAWKEAEKIVKIRQI